MTQPLKKYYTVEEYLDLEEKSAYKSEYFDGEIFMMSGGTDYHSQIGANVITALTLALDDQPCIIYTSDLKVRTSTKGLYTYPDAMVICGDPQFATTKRTVVTNPVMLVEVLSNSTKKYDRGDKFKLYRQIPSLCTYLTLEQNEIYAECYQKQPDNSWLLKTYNTLTNTVTIAQPAIELPLARLYRKIKIPAQEH